MLYHDHAPGHSATGEQFVAKNVNYFDYEYLKPDGSDISVYTESAACPRNQDHLLLHIGLQTREVFQMTCLPLHLVF